MDEPQVEITTYSLRAPDPKSKKLLINECECGAHLWALPWNDSLATWTSFQTSPVRRLFEEKGWLPEKPDVKMHVILCSREDRPLLELRRWRVFRPGPGCRVPWYVQAGPRGLPLQRMILAGAKVVRFLNGCGLDCRRENLVAMTRQELAEEWRARKAAAKKEREAAKAAA
jgi:hypothetical protein